MAIILNIETATAVCSVALSENGKVLAEETDASGQNHAKLLTVLIDQVMKSSQVNYKSLDAVAISKGPGSYTGLRIGTSVAKGICYAREIPLIAINTLQSMANFSVPTDALHCPMIDARRMEVYCQLFDSSLSPLSETEAKALNYNSFEDILTTQKIAFSGDGCAKFKEICSAPNAIFFENALPQAAQMAVLSHKAFLKESFEDVAYFTPFYLKNYQVTQSKKKVF